MLSQRPIVDVVAAAMILLSAVPVYLAARLTGEPAGVSGAR